MERRGIEFRVAAASNSGRKAGLVIGVPKGALRLAALKMLSESSLSGTGLADQIRRASDGEWRPGPGSIYLMLGELLKKGLITELSRREGNVRRYIISAKGKAELVRLSKETDGDVLRQLKLLGVYCQLAGRETLESKIAGLAAELGSEGMPAKP